MLVGAAAWSVAVFFALSGILIGLSVIGRSHTGTFDFFAFMSARVTRIFPPLIAAVMLTVAIVTFIQAAGLYGSVSYRMDGDVAAAREFASIDWTEVLPTLTLTYSVVREWRPIAFNGPLWSLTYEFWCYIVAGLLALSVSSRSWIAVSLMIAVALWLATVSDPLFRTFAPLWFAGFLVGVFWSRLIVLRRWFLPIATMLFVLSMTIGGGAWLSLLKSPYGNAAFYLAVGLSLLCVIAWHLSGRASNGRTLQLLNVVGGFSYHLILGSFSHLPSHAQPISALCAPVWIVGASSARGRRIANRVLGSLGISDHC